MVESDDEQLWIIHSRKGDHAAFEKLIRTHQAMIHALTFRLTGSTADAQDLAQETFVRAYQQLDSFRGTAKFSSWLYRIAVNTCLDWRRREKRRAELHVSWATNAIVEAEAGARDDLDEASREVQAALMKLPEKQRAAISLTAYGGKNHAEAAEILDCSETTISWRIFSARRKLKKLLSKKYSSGKVSP
ncbi:MAG TPA: RNA polymerase sigma factor [Verrucomicrobiae bacterium]|jgi:RNA polymerase sigma-70 factor (ECF subfamily)